ncbi:MAG TPA: MAPEG family protein [Candidatus Binatia bacterium]|nr:MAPEG family protein [Candidatus Binatia bacterium]
MTTSATALLVYAAWTLALVVAIGVLRSTLTLSGRRAANSFAPTGDDVSPFSARLCRAHANCYESLPAFAAIVLVAIVSGHAAITDPLAPWAVAARIGQSTTHIASTSVPAVMLRFTFFLVQVVIQVWWIVRLFELA